MGPEYPRRMSEKASWYLFGLEVSRAGTLGLSKSSGCRWDRRDISKMV